jgi:hypothetical protein
MLQIGRWMASWVNHPVLWSYHLGRGCVLGLLHSYIYAKSHHQATGCCLNYYSCGCKSPQFAGKTSH